jgi:hypothetical protein
MKFTFSVMLAGLIVPAVAHSQTPPTPPWGLGINPPAIVVPRAIRRQLDALEYNSTGAVRGVSIDLNGDGVKDYLIQSAPSLCGNSGCPYAIFDGATQKELGEVFGTPLYVLATSSHGYPVIQTLGHVSAEEGTLTTYAFNGTIYVEQSTRVVKGTSGDSLVSALHRIPLWSPGVRRSP